jgi:lipopolysaccharide/colanic/teichoic acid biosynthesis glycosyltransferase
VIIGANHGLSQQELRELMWVMDEEGVEVWFDAATQFIRTGKGIMIPSKLTTLMVFDPVHLSDGQRIVKRLFDVVFSVIALVAFFPFICVGGIAILLTMGRPVIFVQQRIGRDGKLFSLWKLRTMKDGESSAAPAGMSKNPEDPRITAVGRVLRRWSIDEVPQFLNVLVGTMSVVGPRPRMPEELVSSSITSRRLRAKPGITGPWQTSGRSLMTLNEADALDVNYVDSWSLLSDVVIVLRTVRVVISGHGAF